MGKGESLVFAQKDIRFRVQTMKICISRLRFVSVIEQRGEKLLGLFSKLGGTAVIYRPKTTYVVLGRFYL